MTGSQDAIDTAEAQRMLDAFRGAVVHAEDAADRVLLHRGLLTPVEAGQRAALRRPVPAEAGEPTRTVRGVRRARRVRRGGVARAVGWALALAAGGAVGVALARCLGVRPPLARW